MSYIPAQDGTTRSRFKIGKTFALDASGVTIPSDWLLPAGNAAGVLQNDGTGNLSWVAVGAADQTPYYIPVGQTFTVFANKQVLFAREITVDGELVVDGDLIDVSGAATDVEGMMPYFIPAGETYRVPLYKQGLFAREITVDGDLVIDGDLIDVGTAAIEVVNSLMPYFISSLETYRIPEFKQGLFAVPIDVEGELIVDGILIGV